MKGWKWLLKKKLDKKRWVGVCLSLALLVGFAIFSFVYSLDDSISNLINSIFSFSLTKLIKIMPPMVVLIAHQNL